MSGSPPIETSTSGVRVLPAAAAGWAAVESVMMSEATSRDCWCQFHVLLNKDQQATTRVDRQDRLREQVSTLDPPRGLIAVEGVLPVGWCGVEPRPRLRHVVASRLVAKHSLFPLDDPDVWVVYCILIPPAHRRRGLARLLLAAALEHAESSGARAIEGLPIDLSQRGGTYPPGFSTGTLAMFEREGFASVASLPSGRTLVSRTATGRPKSG